MARKFFDVWICILLLTLLSPNSSFAGALLTWDHGGGETTGYRIYFSQVKGAYADYIEVDNIYSYSLSALPLTEGATYYVIVRAFNTAGESENSNEITYIVPDNTPPSQPQGLTANNQAISLSWTANTETDLKEYRVYYGKTAGNYSPFIPVGKMMNYTFGNLEPGTRYYCAVSAVDQSGNESGYSGTVILTVPSVTGSSTGSSPSSGPVLSWSESDGEVTGYRVYYGTVPGVYPNSWHAGNATQIALMDLSLEEGKTYYFIVRAYNDAGESANSDIVTWTTSSQDTEKPTISISLPTAGAVYETSSSTVNISGSASDNKGVTKVTWKNARGGNGSAIGTTAWSISGVSLAEGENVVTVSATDAAQNTGVQTVTIVYSIPVITTTPIDSTVSSDLAITKLTVASGKTYKIRQNLANGSSCYIDRSYVYSEVPHYLLKSTYIQTSNNDTLRNDTVFLSFDINIAATVYVVVDDRYPVPSWLSGFTNTGDKLRTESLMKIFFKDYKAGRVSLSSNATGGNHYTVMVVKQERVINDVETPTIVINSPTNLPAYETDKPSITLSGTATDNVGIVKVFWKKAIGFDSSVGNDAYGTTNWTIPSTSLIKGDNTITIYALDQAGNQGSASISVKYTPPDTVKPEIQIQKPGIGANAMVATELPTIDIAGVASDDSGKIQQVTWENARGGNGIAAGTANWSISGISLAEGDNVLTVSATDTAGNKGIQMITVLYRIPETIIPLDAVVSPDLAITNLTVASGKPYKVREGLANGSACYIDRSYVYSEVPQYLLKSIYIQTANNDKERNDSIFLTFDINTEATVYVAVDDRLAVPSWLSGFTNTGDKLWTESLMKIFAKDYKAGKVTLSGNGQSGNHYTVMVVKKMVAAPLTISNLTVASGKTYPIKQNLADGAACYIDRSYVYSQVPSYLTQSTYIQTANNDKQRSDSVFLSFDINRPATVYVIYDDRVTVPVWLNAFTRKGEKLQTESLMKIFSKDYAIGRVRLPGNANSGNHYTVVVVAK